MIRVDIPGFGELSLFHLVLDYNGTLAKDGAPIEGVMPRLENLAKDLSVHVITADTFGTVKQVFASMSYFVHVLPLEGQDRAKQSYVSGLGGANTVSVGNGRNDCLMLASSGLGICVIQEEGANFSSMASSDVVVPNILDALDLLTHPKRLVATLRT